MIFVKHESGGVARSCAPGAISVKPLRVLVVTTSYPRYAGDAAGHFVARACEALAARGHAVTVLAPHAPGLPDEETVGGVRVRRFRYGGWESNECVAYGSGIPDNLQSFRAKCTLPFFCRSMRKAIAALAPEHDIIHAHWTPCAWLASSAARRFGKPLLLSVRGSDLNKENPLLRWVGARACAAADHIVAVSESAAERATDFCNTNTAISVLPNGFDASVYSNQKAKAKLREQLGLDAGALCFITVGRLAPVKNTAFLLEAFARLTQMVGGQLDDFSVAIQSMCAEAVPKQENAKAFAEALAESIRRCQLLVVGDGRERAALEAQAAALGIAERVRFVGEVTRDTIPDWLASSDAFVFASRREGRPNALVEAMAVGLPVVATRAAGVSDLIQQGKTGFLVDEGDHAGFVAALAYLAVQPAIRALVGEQAKRFVAEHIPSWEEHAEALERVYVSCLPEVRDAV